VARYLLQRLLALLFVVFVITVICFFIVHLLPGDPAAIICGTSYGPRCKAFMDHQLGLDKPIIVQYFIWLGNVLHGNLGISQTSGQGVNQLISQHLKIDLELILLSQLIAYVVAVPLSVYAARKTGGAMDQSATTVTFAFYCLPSFIIIVWLVQLLVLQWHVLPGPAADPFSAESSFWADLGNNLRTMILPATVLAIGSIALYYRLLRNEMAFTLQEEFITVARSKGLTKNRILWRHALRPSSITMLTSTGNNIALLITGLFIVEYKMQMPGIGYQLVAAIQANDYLTIQGIALVAAIIVVVVNFVIDIITGFVDPRIVRA
jgi:peptide/nickel transport system permease protein